MRLVHFSRPVPSQGPADVVRTYVFLANLAAQEMTGDRSASVGVDRVLTRLAGSEESDALLLGGVADSAPPVIAPVGPLGWPQLPTTTADGNERTHEFAGFAHLSLPLQEETRVVEVDLTLDVDHLPLPGHPHDSAAREVVAELLAGVEHAAAHLGRDIIQLWDTGDHDGPTGYTRAVQVHQWAVDLPEATAPPPAGHRVRVIHDYAADAAAARNIAELFSTASADGERGDLYTEPVNWDVPRLRAAAERMRRRGERNLLVLLEDGTGQACALSEISGHVTADATVATGGVTVVRRDLRGRGLGHAAFAAGLAALSERWPRVRRLYLSGAAGDARTAALLAPHSPDLIATARVWQKYL